MPVASMLQPKLAPRPIGEIDDLFLSATVKDLGRERDAVKEALGHMQIAVFLQDCWNRSAQDVVKMCLDRMEECSGYLGIFGYRYGWIPENSELSITELECRWARHRWSGLASPPVFFFRPEPGSTAADALLKSAEKALAEEFPNDPDKQTLSKERQRQFITNLGYPQDNLIAFSEVSELQIRAMAAISHCNKLILKQASHPDRATNPEIPPDQLGAIGRDLQISSLKKALFARDQRADAPALCVVVQGPFQMGARQFLAYLARWDKWEVERPIESGTPSRDYDVAALMHWAHRLITPGHAVLSTNFGLLADAITAELQHEPLVLMLNNVDGLAGGLSAFHRDFWVPLHGALQERWKPRRNSSRFSMVVTTSMEQHANGDCWCNAEFDNMRIDYRQLIRLPPLGPLRSEDIRTWLDQKNLRRAQCIEIAERADKGDPLMVYEALQGSGVWKDVVEHHA